METKKGPPPSGAPVGIQPQPIVLQPLPRQRTREDYKAKESKILGILQIVAALVIVIFSAVAIRFSVHEGRDLDRLAHGIGSMIMFILSGSFAIASGKKRTPCLIVAHLVLAILASLAAFGLIAKSGAAIGDGVEKLRDEQGMPYGDDMLYPPDYGPGGRIAQEEPDMNAGPDGMRPDGPDGADDKDKPPPPRTENKLDTPDGDMDEDADYLPTDCWFFGSGNTGRIRVNIAASSVILFLAFVELVATIWGSALGCKSMCCTTRTFPLYGHIDPGQPHIVMMDGQTYTMATGPVVSMPTADQAGALPEKKEVKQAFEYNRMQSPPPPYQHI